MSAFRGGNCWADAAYLGSAYNPFTTESDPNSPNYAVQNLKLPGRHRRRAIARPPGVAQPARSHCVARLDRRGEFAGIDKFSRQALEIVTSPRAQEAFDISREDAGHSRFVRPHPGWPGLLAGAAAGRSRRHVRHRAVRRRVGYAPRQFCHAQKSLAAAGRSCVAALVADLHQRGLDRRVLVLVSGEFGRTPTINAQAGRDHWPGAFSVLFAGGGLRVGQVVGATDQRAMHPVTRPYSPGDVLATVYRFLGIDTEQEFFDRSGRPHAHLERRPADRRAGRIAVKHDCR